MSQDYKQTIIEALDIMRKRDVAEKQTFKARAYQKVIQQLKDHPHPIYTYEDVNGITGIGEKISEKIKEILETGTLKSAERVKESYNIDALDAFQNIYGVGAAKANELINKGYTTIDQLRNAIEKNPKLLTKGQTAGLKYYEDLLERIPRKEMDEHKDILEMLIPDESDFQIEIVGSYRRGAETSGDIDVLIKIPEGQKATTSAKYFKDYVKVLQGFGYITDILAQGDKKCMAISAIYKGKQRRLDLLMTPPEEYAYALLYFTGSDKFNVAFRQYVLEQGYKLNEHNLIPQNDELVDPPPMKTEQDIFKFMRLEYVQPHKRIDHNQVQKVKPRKRPTVASVATISVF